MAYIYVISLDLKSKKYIPGGVSIVTVDLGEFTVPGVFPVLSGFGPGIGENDLVVKKQLTNAVLKKISYSGNIDGSNNTFTLNEAPGDLLMVFYNGIKLVEGVGYTMSDRSTVRLNFTPGNEDTLEFYGNTS